MSNHPLKQERESRGWSQARLAELLGTTSRTIGRWEMGQVLPYPYYREQLCTLFGKNARELGLLPDDGISLKMPQEGSAADAFSVVEDISPSLYDPMIPEALGREQRLFGREALLTHLKQRLLGEEGRVLTALSGLPGVGKTSLAATLAMDQQVQASFLDGILWAGVGPQPDTLSLLGCWATLLGAIPATEKPALRVEEWSQILRTAIGMRRMLLVLDDVWEVETAMMMQVGGPNCVYLLTTRLPQVAFAFAEQGAITVPELTEEHAIEFLGRTVPDLVLQEPEQMRALVQAVGGLPLALKLLAHVLSAQIFTGQPRRVQAALTRLLEAEERLRISVPMVPGAHPLSSPPQTPLSLQATIALSIQRLSKEAHMTLRHLAIFPAKPNSFSEEAALAVGQMPLEILDELWDAGLLESHGPERYQLHQTIADYERVQFQYPRAGQEKMVAPSTSSQERLASQTRRGQGKMHQGIPEKAPPRLVRFIRDYLQGHAQDYEALELELSNILAALDVAYEAAMRQDLIAVTDLLVPFLQRRGRYLLAIHYLRRAYEASLASDDAYNQVKILQHLTHFAERSGEYQQAEHYGGRGLELAQQLGLLDAQSALLTSLGQVAFDRGDYAQAITFYEQGLALARQVGNGKPICFLLNLLAGIASLQGRYAQTLEMAQEGLVLARQLNDGESIATLLSCLAQVTIVQGDYTQAESFLLEAFELARQLGYHEMQARTLNSLATIAWNRGNSEQSETYFLQGLKLVRQIGSRTGICMFLANLADLAMSYHRYEEAEGYLQEGLELSRQAENRVFLPSLLANLGELAGYRSEYAQANAYLEEAVGLARQEKSVWLLSNALGIWGKVHLQSQNLAAATLAYQEVLSLHGDPQMVAGALYGLAQVAALNGEIPQAQKLGQESLVAFKTLGHHKEAEVNQWLQNLVRDVHP